MTAPIFDEAAMRVIRATPLLRQADGRMLARMTAGAVLLSLGRGQILYIDGDDASAMFVILSGQVKLYRTGPNGDEAIMHVYGPGDTFGEAALFMGGRHPVSAAAIEPASLVSLPADAVRAAIREAPELAFGMLASVTRHLGLLVDQLEEMKRLTGDERVARLLASLAGVTAGPATVVLPQEKAVIAGRLGITPESFSRALTRLRAEGVEVSGNIVRIADVARLRARLD